MIGPAPASPGPRTGRLRNSRVHGAEQVRNDRPLDHRCDLYAIGAVAYNLVTGRPPFEGESQTRVFDAHISAPVVPPSSVSHDVGGDLERVVLRCLAKAPEGVQVPSTRGPRAGFGRLFGRLSMGLPEGGLLVAGFLPRRKNVNASG